MLYLITDGVGLTRELARLAPASGNSENAIRSVLYSFFHEHFDHCVKSFPCKILKTTGDGLLIVHDPNPHPQLPVSDSASVARGMLKGLINLRNALNKMEPSLHLRAALHSTHPQYPRILGSGICEGQNCFDTDDFFHRMLKSDLFGLDIIYAFRLLGCIQGPYCVASQYFLYALFSQNPAPGSPEDEERILRPRIESWNQTNVPRLSPVHVPIPYLKGLSAGIDLERHGTSFSQPHRVWEVFLEQ